ncbi:hypothetical protein [Streptomyces pluripotens]|uniref:hypothetical protein n=1 Tax=Streptomyces pluripotens TaxID=1355015 RepID=UPI00131A65A4|nr:hypothetical protein [Streptomyces pluripotens]
MSWRKLLLLLIPLWFATFGVAVFILYQQAHKAKAHSNTTVSDGPAYAYITDSAFVLMRGTQVVARAPRKFTAANPDEDQVVWTPTGDYVAFLADLLFDPDSNPKKQEIKFVNTHTGAVGHVSCPGCTSFAAIGANEIIALGDTLMRFNLDAPSTAIPVDSSSLLPAQFNQILGATSGRVLINATDPTQTQLHDQEKLYLLGADGSDIFTWGTFSLSHIFAASAEHTAYGSAQIALKADENPGICTNTSRVSIFDPKTFEMVETDFSAAYPPGYVAGSRNGFSASDMWWGLDGHLRATVTSWTCKKQSSGNPYMTVMPASLWRLDGTRWVKEGTSTEMMVRQLNHATRISLIQHHCAASNTNASYCGSGKLYRSSDGHTSVVADQVISIFMPPLDHVVVPSGS